MISIRVWRARATGARRSIRRIAGAEPVWFAAVAGLAVVGAAVAVSRVESGTAGRWAPAAVVVALAALLEATRPDERIVTILGARFGQVRFVDAVLWLSPALVYLAVRMPASAALALAGIAAVVAVPPAWSSRARRSTRTHSARTRLVATGAIAWTQGLRRAPWPFVGALVVGVLASAHPMAVVGSMLVAAFTATAWHWAPSEGWLMMDASGMGARAYLWRKVGVSWALLGPALGIIVASAGVRAPQLWPMLAALWLACIAAHVAGILCMYAGYEEGMPLSAGGTLAWFVTVLLLIVPPAALIVMLLMERQAVRRLSPFCRVPRERVP